MLWYVQMFIQSKVQALRKRLCLIYPFQLLRVRLCSVCVCVEQILGNLICSIIFWQTRKLLLRIKNNCINSCRYFCCYCCFPSSSHHSMPPDKINVVIHSSLSCWCEMLWSCKHSLLLKWTHITAAKGGHVQEEPTASGVVAWFVFKKSPVTALRLRKVCCAVAASGMESGGACYDFMTLNDSTVNAFSIHSFQVFLTGPSCYHFNCFTLLTVWTHVMFKCTVKLLLWGKALVLPEFSSSVWISQPCMYFSQS